MTTPAADERRRVVAFVTVTMDGCTSGPDGPGSDTWLYEHAVPGRSSRTAARWTVASTTVLEDGARRRPLPPGLRDSAQPSSERAPASSDAASSPVPISTPTRALVVPVERSSRGRSRTSPTSISTPTAA